VGSILVLGGLGAVFAAILVAALALLSPGRGQVVRTLRTVNDGYRVRGSGAAAPGNRHPNTFTRGVGTVGRGLTPPNAVDGLNQRLNEAGNPGWLGIETVLDYKGLLLFAGALAGLLVGVIFAGTLGSLVWIAVGAAVGFFVPNLVVIHLAQERQQEIRRTLPDIMDTLVVTVEAGLGLEAALAQVVRNGRGPMAGEFARVLHEMQIGRPRVDALREMGARTSVAELKTFASAVVQASTLGIPLANVLRQQAAEMRVRRRQRAEELAQKVPVKILFPMIICLLPALFVVVLGPGLIKLLAAFAH